MIVLYYLGPIAIIIIGIFYTIFLFAKQIVLKNKYTLLESSIILIIFMIISAFFLTTIGMQVLFIFDWTGSGNWNISTAIILYIQWIIDAVIGFIFLIQFIEFYRENSDLKKIQ